MIRRYRKLKTSNTYFRWGMDWTWRQTLLSSSYMSRSTETCRLLETTPGSVISGVSSSGTVRLTWAGATSRICVSYGFQWCRGGLHMANHGVAPGLLKFWEGVPHIQMQAVLLSARATDQKFTDRVWSHIRQPQSKQRSCFKLFKGECLAVCSIRYWREDKIRLGKRWPVY